MQAPGGVSGVTSQPLTLALPDALVETVAERVVVLLEQRGHAAATGTPGYLDVNGAAEYLSCPTSRIYALTSAGRIPVHRDGTRLLFDPTELRAYVDQGGATRP